MDFSSVTKQFEKKIVDIKNLFPNDDNDFSENSKNLANAIVKGLKSSTPSTSYLRINQELSNASVETIMNAMKTNKTIKHLSLEGIFDFIDENKKNAVKAMCAMIRENQTMDTFNLRY
jgi:hypothetical protein